MPSATSLRSIREFLALKRIAVAGASRNPADFNTCLFKELRSKGYDAVPVNPQATEIAGVACYKSVGEIDPPVEGVLVMTPARQAEAVVADSHRAGIRKIWLYRAAGEGAVNEATLQFCAQNGMDVVAGYLPLCSCRAFRGSHRLHGGLLKITGRYPA